MIVSQRISSRPALGTGAYAGGIVAGSTLAAAAAVPLATNGDWRQSLLIISAVSLVSIGAWFALVRGDRPGGSIRVAVPHLPWRHVTAWLLVAAFGLQSLMYYGVVAWLPNVFVERGWNAGDAGSLVAVCNGVGLMTTLGVPLIADRFGGRRRQLVFSALASTGAMLAIVLVPEFVFLWVAVLGLALGSIFPLVLTLPLDVTDEPRQVGSVAALMLLGGYTVSALGPFALGAARDATGNFEASLWILVIVGVALIGCCLLLSPTRMRHGIRRQAA
jgi:CP family cyanate transporter-like MFS transporter